MSTTKERKSLSSADERAFWIASGGMCAKCKGNLIYNDRWEGKQKRINLGEKAHVIGHGDDGPRREYIDEYGLDEESIDKLENLILLCLVCHTIVDKNPTAYPPEDLFQMKQKHEQWVLSRLQCNKKSIMVIHKMMGAPISHAQIAGQVDEVLLDSLSLQEEFNDFTPEGWSQAKELNSQFFERVKRKMSVYEGCSLSFFPLSPIPLLIHFGNLISDTIPATIYQFDRQQGVWVTFEQSSEKKQSVNLQISENIQGEKILAVMVSVSARVYIADVSTVLPDSFDVLDIFIDNPALDRVLFSDQVQEVKQVFKTEVERLHQTQRYKALHLFYAGPAGLAIELGRCINTNMWPEVHLYHYRFREDPRYQYALSV